MDHLPGESAYKTAVRDSLSELDLARLSKQPREGHGPWSHTDLLIAAVADRVSQVAHVVACVNSEKGKAPKAPEPIPRPGVARGRSGEDRPVAPVLPISAEAESYFERVRREHRERQQAAGLGEGA